jgi:hypothetical protein
MAENGTCSCGCGALPTISEQAACECGCTCCGTARSREEQITELHRLLDSVQERLTQLESR